MGILTGEPLGSLGADTGLDEIGAALGKAELMQEDGACRLI